MYTLYLLIYLYVYTDINVCVYAIKSTRIIVCILKYNYSYNCMFTNYK